MNEIAVGTKVRFPHDSTPERVYVINGQDPTGGYWILTPTDARADERPTFLTWGTLRDPRYTEVVS